MDLFLLITVLVWLVYFGIIILLFTRADFDPARQAFSDLGSHPIYGKYFNLSLLVISLYQLIIFSRIPVGLFQLPGIATTVVFRLFLTTIFCSIGVAFIRKRYYPGFHNFLSATGFFSCSVAWTLGGIILFPLQPAGSVVLLLWGTVVSTLLGIHFFRQNNCAARFELLFFIGAFLTNLIFITPLG